MFAEALYNQRISTEGSPGKRQRISLQTFLQCCLTSSITQKLEVNLIFVSFKVTCFVLFCFCLVSLTEFHLSIVKIQKPLGPLVTNFTPKREACFNLRVSVTWNMGSLVHPWWMYQGSQRYAFPKITQISGQLTELGLQLCR